MTEQETHCVRGGLVPVVSLFVVNGGAYSGSLPDSRRSPSKFAICEISERLGLSHSDNTGKSGALQYLQLRTD